MELEDMRYPVGEGQRRSNVKFVWPMAKYFAKALTPVAGWRWLIRFRTPGGWMDGITGGGSTGSSPQSKLEMRALANYLAIGHTNLTLLL